MERRRCGFCDQAVTPCERHGVIGIPIVYRYRCAECSAKFDIPTRFGQSLLLGIGTLLPAVVAVLPDRKFGSPSDRSGILVLLMAQLVLFVVIVARGRTNARRHPPM